MKRKYAIILVLVMMLAFAFLCVSFILKNSSWLNDDRNSSGEQVHVKERSSITYDGKLYNSKEKIETLLFIGLDRSSDDRKESYNNQMQSDYLALVVLDHKNKTIDIIHLNRDTICDIPILDLRGNEAGSQQEQLALAHTYGSGKRDSCKNVMKAVSKLLYGIKIDHYFRISIDSVGLLNDAVGGVSVKLEDDFTFADPEMKEGKEIRLQGKQAEIYVRSRKEMKEPTNLARMDRQKIYMKGWIAQAQSTVASNQEVIQDTMLELSEDLVSDLSVYAMSDLIHAAEEYSLHQMVSPKGEATMLGEHMAYYVDEDDLIKMIVDIFYEED